MRRFERVVGVLALGLLGCGKIMPGESGIRGHVPVGTWGEEICASEHEISENPICAKVERDGSFELALPSGTYWLCIPDRYSKVRCPSLCPYPVSEGEVTVVDPADLSPPKPDGQGFYGTSRGSFGEFGYLDVQHPLRVCVGPPDTPFATPISKLTCVETDRCGRYALSVPEGSYRVLFAEMDEETTSDRQDCLYRVTAGQATHISRVTGRGASDERAACGEGSTPDPITGVEMAPKLQNDTEMRVMIPPVITTDEQHVAFPISSMEYEDYERRVTLRGSNFFGERGKVKVRRLGNEEFFEMYSHQITWSSDEISFDMLSSGIYEVSVSRPDGVASHPPEALVVCNVPLDIVVSGSEALTVYQLKVALEAVQPAVLACATKYDAPPGLPIPVHFTLQSPDVVRAKLAREEQAVTPLGSCMKSVAKKVTFPTLHDGEMRFMYSFVLE